MNELVRDIEGYLAQRNANPRPYKWKAEGAAILEKSSAHALLSKRQSRMSSWELIKSQDTSVAFEVCIA
ncbi:MAG: hypothetical protein HC850_17960 [Rhodomicrobium sp.]|nr:hypothetical protein [Rhodomicrobium sp.]